MESRVRPLYRVIGREGWQTSKLQLANCINTKHNPPQGCKPQQRSRVGSFLKKEDKATNRITKMKQKGLANLYD